ncbi:MAG: hypothetical protein R3C10_16360 [Pirellulales bacterium]
MIDESVTAIVGFVEAELVDHRTHRPVEHHDPLSQNGVDWARTWGRWATDMWEVPGLGISDREMQKHGSVDPEPQRNLCKYRRRWRYRQGDAVQYWIS